MKSQRSFRDLFEEARQHEDYWKEGLGLEVAEELSRLMTEKDISQGALAERVGRSPVYIAKVLRGDANLTIAVLVKLARALDSEVRIHLA
ncbi:MAG TPA: helix-turn-helix transcriptional regulator [Thermoanaerobaculia bacterium]|nr:helix-turn-helix transcriptional regulator [Thermoanaerobaculia bacterium]